jgi:hypothetical protein
MASLGVPIRAGTSWAIGGLGSTCCSTSIPEVGRIRCGFPIVYNGSVNFEVAAFGFTKPPTEEILRLLSLPPAVRT